MKDIFTDPNFDKYLFDSEPMGQYRFGQGIQHLHPDSGLLTYAAFNLPFMNPTWSWAGTAAKVTDHSSTNIEGFVLSDTGKFNFDLDDSGDSQAFLGMVEGLVDRTSFARLREPNEYFQDYGISLTMDDLVLEGKGCSGLIPEGFAKHRYGEFLNFWMNVYNCMVPFLDESLRRKMMPYENDFLESLQNPSRHMDFCDSTKGKHDSLPR